MRKRNNEGIEGGENSKRRDEIRAKKQSWQISESGARGASIMALVDTDRPSGGSGQNNGNKQHGVMK